MHDNDIHPLNLVFVLIWYYMYVAYSEYLRNPLFTSRQSDTLQNNFVSTQTSQIPYMALKLYDIIFYECLNDDTSCQILPPLFAASSVSMKSVCRTALYLWSPYILVYNSNGKSFQSWTQRSSACFEFRSASHRIFSTYHIVEIQNEHKHRKRDWCDLHTGWK